MRLLKDSGSHPPKALYNAAELVLNHETLEPAGPQASYIANRMKDHGILIDLVFIRPSQDIGHLAGEYEPRLPLPLRHMLGGIGSRETRSPDLLSLLMFHPDYLRRLIEIGEEDFEARSADVAALLEGSGPP